MKRGDTKLEARRPATGITAPARQRHGLVASARALMERLALWIGARPERGGRQSSALARPGARQPPRTWRAHG
ncbi:MAG: hypothetical protein ACE5O2_17045, partial [Armatimonadota bacterium]